MRVLQLTKKFPFPRKDGEAWAVLALAEGLVNSGIVIDLFSISSDSTEAESESIEGLKRLGIYDQIDLIEADTSPRKIPGLLNMLSSKSYHQERYELQNVSDELEKFARQNSYDFLISETVYMMQYALSLEGTAKVILRAHNLEHLIWSRYGSRKGLLKSKYFKLQSERLKVHEFDMMRKADGILPISSHDDVMISKALSVKTKSWVTPVGMNIGQPITQEKDGLPLIIGFIGSLGWRPNAEGIKWFIDEVWPTIYNSDREVRFMIAGRLGGDIDRFRCVDGVAVIGEVEDSEQFIRGLDIMVAPILSGSGTRVKILQSLSIGIPVVATTMAMEGLDLHQHKEIIIADNPSAWRTAIDSLAEDINLWATISKGGQKYLKDQHDIQKIGAQVKRFISEL